MTPACEVGHIVVLTALPVATTEIGTTVDKLKESR